MAQHGIRDELWRRALELHDDALADGTRSNYESALNLFRAWVRAERIAYGFDVAVPEQILCAYAASLAGNLAGGSARTRLGALRFWHDHNNWTWLGSERLRRILKRVEQVAPPTSVREMRPPVTEAMLDEALTRLSPSRPFDVCVAAALLVIFWGQLRLGEVLSATRTYDFASFPTRKCVSLRGDCGGAVGQVTTALWLPRTKTARSGEYVWLARHFNDPSRALLDHFARNNVSREDPLFCYRPDGLTDLVALTRNAFLGRLNEIWTSAGMSAVTGHSFRIGGDDGVATGWR